MFNFNGTTELYVFGDSLSDVGNSFALTLGAIPPDPPYVSGRFSNGLVAVEYLAQDLGVSLNPYYDDGSGNNFAVGGARTGTGNSNNDDIAPFLPGVTLPGLTQQIDAFEQGLGDSNADPDALYLVWAGANNFLDYLGGGFLGDPANLIAEAIAHQAENLNRLRDLGANNFVVPNLPSLGRLPFSSEFAAEANAISIAYNGGLSLALNNLDLASDSASVQIAQIDLFSFAETIVSNPQEFALNDISTPLLLSGLDPASTTGFFFWDIFHPTTQVHALFAEQITQTLQGTIPQPVFNNLVGSEETDLLFGTQAADNVDGLGGDDFIFGNQGNDQLEGWSGRDFLWGGEGNDIIDGGENRDYLEGGAGADLLFGSQGDDYLRGNSGQDILIGGEDNDYLLGGSGNDYLLGGNGSDRLWGNTGDDTINGGEGEDLLQGGSGNDLIDGGAGCDRLLGNEGIDIFELTANFGRDTIVDFQLGTDRLMLSGGLSFNDLSFGNEQISLTATNEILAVLSGIDTTTLGESDFVV